MTIKNEEMSEKKKLSKKSKVIISVVSILIVLAIIISSCFIWQNSQAIKLITNTKTIEYGEIYTPNLKDFVEEKKLNDKYSIDGNIPNEEGKEYPAIGEYKLIVKKNKQGQEVVLKVKDTVAPAFAEDIVTTISTAVNTPLDDVTAQYKDKVTDLDDIKVTVNNSSSSGESTTTKPSNCTNNSNHSIKCGNMGRWFNSRKEVEEFTNKEIDKWMDKYSKGEISREEFLKHKPDGYECWSCSYCGKWTGNFKSL